MDEPVFRIFSRAAETGALDDENTTYGLSAFGGVYPSVGDRLSIADLPDEILTVVERVISVRNGRAFVALVVERREPTPAEQALLWSGSSSGMASPYPRW